MDWPYVVHNFSRSHTAFAVRELYWRLQGILEAADRDAIQRGMKMKVLYNPTNAWNLRGLACCGLDFVLVLCQSDGVQQSCSGVHGCDAAVCFNSLLINQPVSEPGVYLVTQSAQPFCSVQLAGE